MRSCVLVEAHRGALAHASPDESWSQYWLLAAIDGHFFGILGAQTYRSSAQLSSTPSVLRKLIVEMMRARQRAFPRPESARAATDAAQRIVDEAS